MYISSSLDARATLNSTNEFMSNKDYNIIIDRTIIANTLSDMVRCLPLL